ncbi:MAG: response regulator [Verrucomicrobiota bacterium]
MSEEPKQRILLVDDEEGFTSLMKIQLEASERYEVRVVNESPRAIGEAKDFRPDVILLDVVMPDMDGGDVSTLLKQDESLKDIPVIFVTALSAADYEEDEESASEEARAGQRIVLSKPLRTEKVLRVLDRLLGG